MSCDDASDDRKADGKDDPNWIGCVETVNRPPIDNGKRERAGPVGDRVAIERADVRLRVGRQVRIKSLS